MMGCWSVGRLGRVLGEVLGGWRMGGVWGVQCLDWCLVFLNASFLVWARTKMKATAKCDQHCELHDSVNHLKVERMLLFRVVLEIMFSECHCLREM